MIAESSAVGRRWKAKCHRRFCFDGDGVDRELAARAGVGAGAGAGVDRTKSRRASERAIERLQNLSYGRGAYVPRQNKISANDPSHLFRHANYINNSHASWI